MVEPAVFPLSAPATFDSPTAGRPFLKSQVTIDPGPVAEAGIVKVVPLSVPTLAVPSLQVTLETAHPARMLDSLMVTAAPVVATTYGSVPVTAVLPSTWTAVPAVVVVAVPVVCVVLVSVNPQGPPVPPRVVLRRITRALAPATNR